MFAFPIGKMLKVFDSIPLFYTERYYTTPHFITFVITFITFVITFIFCPKNRMKKFGFVL